jgi:hypothetical protein
VVIYHAWEQYQLKHGKPPHMPMPRSLNPIQLAWGYFHLRPIVLMRAPGCTDRGNRADVEKVL